MLILHGFPYSNYYNIVKHALMIKGIPFEERIVYPNAPEIMAVNPTGKVPAMTTEQGTLLGANLDDTLKDQVRAVLDRGARSIAALANFSPYVLGEQLTLADIYLRYALSLPKMVGPSQLDWNVKDKVPGLAEWGVLMADSDISRKIDADMRDNAADFRDYISKNAN
jgi:glutathione S-transferase